ncbi:ribonuclease P protein subunit p30 isoform X2 [Photinus pyralis]|uniref:ribonuclease P protein subunit p30 isoform X2 n=1 Tax=Photinus pyralis TaxID=7054 RepID=UPI0012670430|nr:ribonuclease P protein subunit p30 isoform X2 [Photinus pyralis]
MDSVKGYFDYNIPNQCISSDFERTAKRLCEFGYCTIAINQTIDESALEESITEGKKKKKIDKGDIVPPPIYPKGYETLKILNRLTIAFTNPDIINRIIKSPNFKKYDIIAAQPESQQAFQFTCTSFEADIFSFNPSTKPNYRLQRKLYYLLIERGAYFELMYGPAIEDSTKRKNILATAHMYHSFGKSRNIIISSGITNSLLLRSPYDVTNLGLLFGLTDGQAKDAVLNNGRNVYIHGVGRRLGKTILLFESLTNEEYSVDNQRGEDEEMELDQPALKKSKQYST